MGRRSTASARFLKGLLDLLTVLFLTRFGRRPAHVLGSFGLAAGSLGGAAWPTSSPCGLGHYRPPGEAALWVTGRSRSAALGVAAPGRLVVVAELVARGPPPTPTRATAWPPPVGR